MYRSIDDDFIYVSDKLHTMTRKRFKSKGLPWGKRAVKYAKPPAYLVEESNLAKESIVSPSRPSLTKKSNELQNSGI